MPLAVGSEAPDFTATAHSGEQLTLSHFRGSKLVVLYFYPSDGTPGCTKEACSFRDRHEEFLAAGAAVIGVSANSLDQHRRFADRQSLPFYLVSDADGALRKAYEVTPSLLGLIPARVTFVIDQQGIVRSVTNAQFSPLRHIEEALETVQQLASR